MESTEKERMLSILRAKAKHEKSEYERLNSTQREIMKKRPLLHIGKALMLALKEIDFELYERLVGTKYDCSTNVHLIPNCRSKILEKYTESDRYIYEIESGQIKL